MSVRTEEMHKLPPEKMAELLKAKGTEFEITAGEDENTQIIRVRAEELTPKKLVYRSVQLLPGRMLKEIELTVSLTPKGGGSLVKLSGSLVRHEVPPGTPRETSGEDVRHELAGVWTYIKNFLAQEAMAEKAETAERTYNAGMRELFTMLKDPSLLAPAQCITIEKDDESGRLECQDATGSLVFRLQRTALEEPKMVTFRMSTDTAGMYRRSGTIEFVMEKVNEAKTRLRARAVSERSELSEQMQMSAMYLPPEQLSAFLSFRQDLSTIMGWIDAAVPLQIPHIRDMFVVQGDFVAGGKVEVRDSVLSRTEIRTGAAADDGRYLVHADRTVGSKVDIKESVVHRSEIGPVPKNVEVYFRSLKAAYLDGRIDDSEAAMLQALQESLSISPEEHLAVMEELGALETENATKYSHVLATTLADGKLDDSEEAVLGALRQQYGIPLVVHQALVTKLGKNI